MNTTHKGFTLIEMMVVVAIVGILSSLVLIGLGPVQQRGRDARRISDLRQVQTALELVYSKTGSYPANGTWAQLQTAIQTASVGVSRLPLDPRSGGDIAYANQYQYASDGSSYVLVAHLEDAGSQALQNGVVMPAYGSNAGISGTCGTAGLYCITL